MSRLRQGLPIGENLVITSMVSTAPNDEVARIIPKPCEPTFKISSANTGNSATAPPKKTEKRSRLIAQISILLLKTKSTPSERLCHTLCLGINTGGYFRRKAISTIDTLRKKRMTLKAAVTP